MKGEEKESRVVCRQNSEYVHLEKFSVKGTVCVGGSPLFLEAVLTFTFVSPLEARRKGCVSQLCWGRGFWKQGIGLAGLCSSLATPSTSSQ